VDGLRYCVLIPHFNHHEQLARFFPDVAALGLPVMVVDDGSDTDSFAAIQELQNQYPELMLERLEKNRGKGAAVILGLKQAREYGFTHVIQIDADGQHNAADIIKMKAASESTPDAMISGLPLFGDDIPKARLHGRKLSLFWVRVETLSTEIKDAMCGFRVYPVDAMLTACDAWLFSLRMQFDLEVLVRWIWSGRRIVFVESDVQYPAAGKSHFRMVRDNVHITLMHIKLVLGMLLRSPVLLFRKLARNG